MELNMTSLELLPTKKKLSEPTKAMETSSALLPPHECLKHSCLSLTGHRCHSQSSNAAIRAPHRSASGPTADKHHYTSASKLTGKASCIHRFLLLSLLFSLLFEGCGGLVVKSLPEELPTTEPTPTRGERVAAAVDRTELWDNATVPFVFDKGLPMRSKRQTVKAMRVWMKHTDCIKFVPRTDEQFYIILQADPSICDSFTGKSFFGLFGLGQPVKLAWECTRGNIMHELGHVLGFYHEHVRPDRDQFIRIHEENIIPRFLPEFHIKTNVVALGAKYDYESIMHWPLNVKTIKNDTQSMEVVGTYYGEEIGQRKKLSDLDKDQVNSVYRCEDPGANTHMMLIDPDIIQDGDWIILCPRHIPNPRSKYRLECTSDNCTTSTCAGTLFKQNDVVKCPQLMISIQKVASQHPLIREDKVIRTGDTVSLRWEEPSTSMFQPVYCDQQNCTLGCPSDSTDCNERYSHFTVQVQGKGRAINVMHRDLISFHSTVSTQFGFACSPSGLCTLQPCGNCDGSDFLFHLQKY